MAGQTTNYLFDYPTSTDYVKDGATAIETLADDVDTTLFTALGGAYPGLRLIKKQTIGTAVSSVTVTGAFSATYENYRIIVSGGVASTAIPIDFRCGTTTTGYMWAGSFAGVSGSGGFGDPSASSIRTGEADTNSLRSSFDVLNPFDAKYTSVLGGFGYSIGNENMRTFTGILKDTTSYTSFTIVGTGGTMTGGTIYVYGYGAS
jgi:hypothetical protein